MDERVSPPVHEKPVLMQIPAHAAATILKPARKAPSRWFQSALFWLSAAVVSFVLGYLTGPIVNKHWGRSLHAEQRSLFQSLSRTVATKADNGDLPQTAVTVSAQTMTDQRPQAKSLSDLRALADRGDSDAQWQMGVRYHNGEDVVQDDAQAVQWFLRAAEQGHVTAQATLGAYYWAGRGVPADLTQAYIWSTIALAQGDDNSKSRLEGLASQMTQAQVSAARQQAEAWIHAHNSAKQTKK